MCNPIILYILHQIFPSVGIMMYLKKCDNRVLIYICSRLTSHFLKWDMCTFNLYMICVIIYMLTYFKVL